MLHLYLEDARGYETEISFRVIGYIMGADKNEERPKVVTKGKCSRNKDCQESMLFSEIYPEHLHMSAAMFLFIDQ